MAGITHDTIIVNCGRFRMPDRVLHYFIANLNGGMISFLLGIYLMIAVMGKSGLSTLFGDIVLNLVDETKNLYAIAAILFLGAALMTQFMNNMGCAGMLTLVSF